MPNRIIRESLLDSSRYLAIDEGAQLLFTHLLLLADDFGCLSLEYSFIGRRCFVNRPSDERLDRLVAQLVDVDLIRIYEYRNLRYAFIPRFRQRLKRETLKNPRPPDELLDDDDDAQEKFHKLNGQGHKGAALGPPGNGTVARLPSDREVKGSKGMESVGMGTEAESKGAPLDASRSPKHLADALAAKMRFKNS